MRFCKATINSLPLSRVAKMRRGPMQAFVQLMRVGRDRAILAEGLPFVRYGQDHEAPVLDRP
jgi:hypothetical protein